MSYKLIPSSEKNLEVLDFDTLAVTKKGHTEGGLPYGVIFPIEAYFCGYINTFEESAKNNKVHLAVVKRDGNDTSRAERLVPYEDEPLYNAFGAFVSTAPIFDESKREVLLNSPDIQDWFRIHLLTPMKDVNIVSFIQQVIEQEENS